MEHQHLQSQTHQRLLIPCYYWVLSFQVFEEEHDLDHDVYYYYYCFLEKACIAAGLAAADDDDDDEGIVTIVESINEIHDLFGGAPWCAPEAKGALGPPVNCCTMALKFEVSVLRKIVGVRLEALDLQSMGLDTRPPGLK
ncbi:hypothetical protein CMV_023556 [Castanea mollissima]|uniref:Uncharacterized protein n=1 Tax=Castanea mollissima TaxID=60419 RepID=A0A8J4VJ77_9ROSI|nr:hypothetical protein CMV_023556 [Castanea mollissima]